MTNQTVTDEFLKLDCNLQLDKEFIKSFISSQGHEIQDCSTDAPINLKFAVLSRALLVDAQFIIDALETLRLNLIFQLQTTEIPITYANEFIYRHLSLTIRSLPIVFLKLIEFGSGPTLQLHSIPDAIRENKLLVTAAVRNCNLNYKSLNTSHKEDPEIVTVALLAPPVYECIFEHVPDNTKENYDLVVNAIKITNGKVYPYLLGKHQESKDIAMRSLMFCNRETAESILKTCPESFKSDLIFGMTLHRHGDDLLNGFCTDHVINRLRHSHRRSLSFNV